MELTLEALGLSQEAIADRVVDRIVERMLFDVDGSDEHGDPVSSRSKFQDALKERVRLRIDTAIDEVAAKNVLPNVATYLENLVLQKTNEWGQKQGVSQTFIEYLVQRAEAYMQEPVDYEGKTKAQSGSYNWSKSQTRVTHLVEKHLHYSIDTAMKAALADANSAIVGGIAEAVKIKLEEVKAKLKVTVATK